MLGLENNVIATARGTGSSGAWYLYNKDVRGSTSSLIDDGGTAAAAYAVVQHIRSTRASHIK